jgi:hypothetical protein
MQRWHCSLIRGIIVLAFVVGSARGRGGTSPLKAGDLLPPLVGQTVAGKQLDLPAATERKVAVVIFSFSRTGGQDARSWEQHISKDDPNLPLYTAIFLESVPRLFRSLAISDIRSTMPPAMLGQTLLLYQQQTFWKQRLRVTDENHACVLVLDRSGRIRWISLGPYADALYVHLRKETEP